MGATPSQRYSTKPTNQVSTHLLAQGVLRERSLAHHHGRHAPTPPLVFGVVVPQRLGRQIEARLSQKATKGNNKKSHKNKKRSPKS